MKKTNNLDVALWRFGIISPLLHRSVNDLLLREMLEDLALRHFVHPGGHCVQVRDGERFMVDVHGHAA